MDKKWWKHQKSQKLVIFFSFESIILHVYIEGVRPLEAPALDDTSP